MGNLAVGTSGYRYYDPGEGWQSDYSSKLHGRNEDRFDYDYDYSAAELEELAIRLESIIESREQVYCFFNTYEMYDNAREFMNIVGRDV